MQSQEAGAVSLEVFKPYFISRETGSYESKRTSSFSRVDGMEATRTGDIASLTAKPPVIFLAP